MDRPTTITPGREDTPETITEPLQPSDLTITLIEDAKDNQNLLDTSSDPRTGQRSVTNDNLNQGNVDRSFDSGLDPEQDSRGRSMERTYCMSDDVNVDTRGLMGFGGLLSGDKLHLLLSRREDSRNATRLHRAMLRSRVP